MKKMKTTFLTLALCIMCTNVKAQTVSVADVEALPGETVSFTLDLSGGKVDTYIALQFDVHFPNNNFTTTGDYSVSSKWKNATSVVGSVDANGVATIPVSSAESISEANVEGLLTIDFTVGSNVPVGEYDVTLENLWFGYGISSKDYVDDVTFKVKVVAKHTIVLDELSTTAPANATGVDVTVKRTINANEWSTICLPFAMSTAQVKEAFGDDVKLADFDGIETTYDTDENVTNIRVKFNEATSIEANHPYLIEVTNAITSFSTENVDIEVEDEPSVDKDEYRTGSGTKKDPYVFHYNSFIGSYVAATDIPEECLFLNENKFWYSTGMTKMKAFRAYFDFYDVLSDVENAAARIIFAFSDETTGIHSIDNLTISPIDNDAPMYNLAGQKVNKSYKGIVIQNGVKRIVK